MEYTNIRVTKEVREELKTKGTKDETYNEIIKRLLKENDKKQ